MSLPPAAPRPLRRADGEESSRIRAAREAALSRRLLFIGDRLPALVGAVDGSHAGRHRRLVEECRRAAASARLPAAHPAESVTWVGIGAMNQALAWLLTGEEGRLAEARRWIRAACGWRDWGHAFLVNVDLSAAWLLWGLSLCHDWLRDALPAEELATLRAELARHAGIMHDYRERTAGEGWSTNFWQNHNWINMNGLAAAGYALEGIDARAEAWIAAARENFRFVLAEMAPDGSDYEGTAYWRYGVPWLAAYAELLREREGEDLFASSAFLRETFWYRLHQCAPGFEETVNFGDCHDDRSSHSIALYLKLASEYRIGQARWLADRVEGFLHREQHESGIRPGILCEAGLEYLWFDPSVAPEPPDGLPTARFFPDLGLLASRESWGPDAAMLSVKCGPPGGARQWARSAELARERGWDCRGLSHRHPDDNAFVIRAAGARLACDEGYSRELFSAHHNAILVDGRGYADEGRNNIWKSVADDRVAVLEECRIGDGGFLFRGECSRCYPAELGLLRVARTIVQAARAAWIVVDELEAAVPRRFEWLLQSEVEPLDLGDRLEWRDGRGALTLWTLEPDLRETSLRDTVVRAVMTPQEPDKCREARLVTLGESAGPATSLRFVHVLAAGPAGRAPGVAVSRADLPGGGLELRIEGPGGVRAWRVRGGKVE